MDRTSSVVEKISPPPKPFSRAALLGWLIAFALFEVVVVGSVLWARQTVIAQYGTPAAQAGWDEWRASAQKMRDNKTGSVERRVPKSVKPPGLVLMQDSFPALLMGSVVLSGVLFLATAAMFQGAVLQRQS